MKILTKLMLLLLALVAVTLIVALFLPAKYHVERSITIQASPAAIFPYLNDLKKWPEWTAWNKEQSHRPLFWFDDGQNDRLVGGKFSFALGP